MHPLQHALRASHTPAGPSSSTPSHPNRCRAKAAASPSERSAALPDATTRTSHPLARREAAGDACRLPAVCRCFTPTLTLSPTVDAIADMDSDTHDPDTLLGLVCLANDEGVPVKKSRARSDRCRRRASLYPSKSTEMGGSRKVSASAERRLKRSEL
jgi:hypothetical protein